LPLQAPRRLLKMKGPLFQDIYPTMVMTHELQVKQSPNAIIFILYTRKNENNGAAFTGEPEHFQDRKSEHVLVWTQERREVTLVAGR
jgi:hypothetical protein